LRDSCDGTTIEYQANLERAVWDVIKTRDGFFLRKTLGATQKKPKGTQKSSSKGTHRFSNNQNLGGNITIYALA
jgi:hypothetical protein